MTSAPEQYALLSSLPTVVAAQLPLRHSSTAAPPTDTASCSSCAEAKGVVANRLQNVVITLDKVKMVLQAPKQVRGCRVALCFFR